MVRIMRAPNFTFLGTSLLILHEKVLGSQTFGTPCSLRAHSARICSQNAGRQRGMADKSHAKHISRNAARAVQCTIPPTEREFRETPEISRFRNIANYAAP